MALSILKGTRSIARMESLLSKTFAAPSPSHRKMSIIDKYYRPWDTDFMGKFYEPFDLKLILKRSRDKMLQNEQMFLDKHFAMLGPELAAAHFIVMRGGAVRFEGSERWLSKDKTKWRARFPVPDRPNPALKVEAIDASNSRLTYQGMDNFVKCEYLKYLRLSGCVNVDDWCLDRLVHFRDTLQVLDLSGCPSVTERGLSSLHRMRVLKRLRLDDMAGVSHKGLLAIMLEEVLPGCLIEGIDYTDTDMYLQDEGPRQLPLFIRSCADKINIETGETLDDTPLLDEGELRKT